MWKNKMAANLYVAFDLVVTSELLDAGRCMNYLLLMSKKLKT
jgi:hypothetical protein